MKNTNITHGADDAATLPSAPVKRSRNRTARNALTASGVANYRLPQGVEQKRLFDGNGLFLLVKSSWGKVSKLWYLRYRLGGKQSDYALGPYPAVTLAEARKARDVAKELIAVGKNPSTARKQQRAFVASEQANTFESVARAWLARNEGHWTGRTLGQRKAALERYVFPDIGSFALGEITPAMVSTVIRKIEKTAPTVAAITRQSISQVFCHAAGLGLAESDPTALLKGALKPHKRTHHKPLARGEIKGFMAALLADAGEHANKVAIKLTFLTLARSMEVLGAKWSEFDLAGALWTIPAGRMKKREEHKVPLSRQALELLTSLKGLTGEGEFLFPNRKDRSKPVSQGVMWKTIERIGYAGVFSPHGIRATGSTILNGMNYRADLIEMQLAHKDRNQTRAAYNSAEYLIERLAMMQDWADLLDSLTTGGKVIEGNFGKVA